MPDFLIADDEQQIRNMIKQYLSELGHVAVTVSNGQEALEKLFNNKFSGLFTDLRMPGLDGIGLLNAINEEQILIPTVVVTAYATVELSAELFKLGIKDLITKPFSPEEIKSAANLTLKYSLDLKRNSPFERHVYSAARVNSELIVYVIKVKHRRHVYKK